MAVTRAAPQETRVSLEMAHQMAKYGISFVPMPVSSPEKRGELMAEALQSIAELVRLAEQDETTGSK